MAQAYVRQSTFADGDTITAALFNDEYNQLVNAFAYSSSSASSTGHRHDGTAGQGGNINTIGDLDFLNKIVPALLIRQCIFILELLIAFTVSSISEGSDKSHFKKVIFSLS